MTTSCAHKAGLRDQATEHARFQKGNALVEFALMLPLFLFLVLGMITFSIALYDKTILTMATREGARTGAVTNSQASAQTAADAFQGNLITFGTPPGSTPFAANINSGIVTVTADYLYTGLPSPFWNLILPSTMNLKAQTTMKVE
jgi:Flp pilus assembly protein TadG